MEACLALPFVFLTMGFGLDLVRRVQLQMAFHHAACVGARHLVLEGTAGVDRAVRRALRTFGGDTSGAVAGATITPSRAPGYAAIRLHFRYPQFSVFPWRDKNKHHFEVSESCSFPTG